MLSFMAADGKAAISCEGSIKEVAADMFVVIEALYNNLRREKGSEYGYVFLHMLAANIEVILEGGEQ